MSAARHRPPARRRTHAWALVAGLAATAVLVLAAPRSAAAGTTLRLTLGAQAAQGQHPGVELVAHLAAPVDSGHAHQSLGGVTVTFALHLDEFAGAPLLVLGSATTNSAGEALLTYDPTFTGKQPLVATATDSSGNTIATAATTYTATAAVHPLAGSVEAVRPDGPIGKVVVGVLLALVAFLWIVLITVVVRVQRVPRPSPR